MSVIDLAKRFCVVIGVASAMWGGVACSGAFPSDGRLLSPAESQAVKSYAFLHGRWFDGKGFQQTRWYSVQGRLTRNAPPGVVETVDLGGAFVVPPFGEAHNHNVNGPWNVDQVIRRYMKDGVFYVKIPGDIGEFTDQIRPKINLPTSIDVIFSHGGLTATGGWPISLYEDNLRQSRYEPVLGPLEKGWFNNRAYFRIDHEADLESKWNMILAGKPDFLKTFLAHSEHFGRPKDRSTAGVHTGLDPELLPRIVAKAHEAGLRVSTHVETAADFRQAVRASVDEITHLPGWWVPRPEDLVAARLTEKDAEDAAGAGVVVVTTTVAGQRMPGHSASSSHEQSHGDTPGGTRGARHQPGDTDAARDVQQGNLRLLHEHHVRIAVGSDHGDTSLDEALNLHALAVFDNVTLLKLWCESTPKAIFPGRKIGRFEEGYEASFLTLAGNPLEDFNQVRAIRLRFKQGFPMPSPDQGVETPSKGTGPAHTPE